MVINSSSSRDGNIKPRGKIMGLFKKFIPTRTKIESTSQNSTDSENHVFDALLPEDPGRESVESETNTQPDNSGDNGNNTTRENCRNSNSQSYTSKTPSAKNVTTYYTTVGENATVSHIGPVTSISTQYMFNSPRSNVDSKRQKETEKIKVLLKARDLIRVGHLEFLSNDLGTKWSEVGRTLGLSESELYTIRKQWKDHKERAFQVLMLWWNHKREGRAEVGELCRILWEGESKAAWKAIENLSLNIELFK